MARALIAIGVSGVRAYELARRVEVDLATRDERAVELDRLQELAIDVLGPIEGREAVRRLRRYNDLEQLDLPIILLLGGATGTGQVDGRDRGRLPARDHAPHLDRLHPPDHARVLLRGVHAHDPPLQLRGVARPAGAGAEEGDPVLRGFLEQTRNVLVGVRASIDRALEEGWSMVLEGVHLVPGMLPPEIDGALVVQCVLGDRRRGGARRALLRPRRGPDGSARSTSTSTGSTTSA